MSVSAVSDGSRDPASYAHPENPNVRGRLRPAPAVTRQDTGAGR
ncbi:hypothetical protein [Streptomyces sp. MST-110588]|nr:hypothetical protein [Streptomyces sp. MST-110588]